MAERNFKQELIDYFKSLELKNEKTTSIGSIASKSFSVQELIHEIESDSEVGRRLVERYGRYLLSCK